MILAGTDLAAVTRDQLADALAVHGLDFDRHLRHMDDPVLPWQVVDAVNPAAGRQLAAALTEREARP
ncbi:hypothetical protein ACWEP8_33440 [Streptomyces hydrogenans]